MNTLKIGDEFEEKSYHLIVKAIENNELGITQSTAKVFRNKGYYSAKREKNIIFDLSIEIWPDNAERYSFIFLIECKSSNSKKVPVDDVEEFWSKIDQVSGKNVKGVMISDNSFQRGAIDFSKNTGMMLIEVDSENDHKIILHRTEKNESSKDEKAAPIEDVFSNFIRKTLGLKKVSGLRVLSANQIEELAANILKQFNYTENAIEVNHFIEQLKAKYELDFDFTKNLETVKGKKILGFYDINKKVILIDNSIIGTTKLPFVLGHELGHYFLHSDLRVNQELYNDFEDSHYDIATDTNKLVNDKNWIEWQANRFAVSLLLPNKLFLAHFLAFRKYIGISRPHHIYLDDQNINQQDYYKTIDYLADYFKTSKTSVKYRIEDLELITYLTPKKDLRSQIRRAIFE
jgi:Zn-dependent peptidase ImmA (M78 family)